MSKLQESFGAVYTLLEKPRAARGVVASFLAIHTLLLGYSAYVHSPTLNEPGHLVAGLSEWKFGRFELYRVNPPLVRMVAALPVMAAGYNEDWNGFYEWPGARPEMSMGEDFVAANQARSFFLFAIARWACIPFSWLGMIVCYLWSRDLFGRPAGVMAATIWCFEPNIVAHASLITPDAGATALGLAACYTFWRWLKNPTWSQAALTGVVLGLAELAKTTLVIFYPIWPLMWLIYRFAIPRSLLPVPRQFFREAGMLTIYMAIGLYILNLGYGFEGSFTRLKDFYFVSNLFTGRGSTIGGQEHDRSQSPNNAPPAAENPQPEIQYAKLTNRFNDSWLGMLPVPLPKHYLLGVDIQQRDFEHYGHQSYLRGIWQDHGWWYYYLYACAIKVPLGLWALGFLAMAASCTTTLSCLSGQRLDKGNWPTADYQRLRVRTQDLFILFTPALVVFIVVSSKTGFSEHMRYVLPSFPFFFVAIGRLAQLFAPSFRPRRGRPSDANSISPPEDSLENVIFEDNPNRNGSYLTFPPPKSYHSPIRLGAVPSSVRLRFAYFLTLAVAVSASWAVVSSLYFYPHSLSYFNESIGGSRNGRKHLLGSNVDWGQDDFYFEKRAKGFGRP